MTKSRTMVDYLVDFNKILNYLKNIKVKVEYRDKVVLLLNVLPGTFEHFKDIFLFRKE